MVGLRLGFAGAGAGRVVLDDDGRAGFLPPDRKNGFGFGAVVEVMGLFRAVEGFIAGWDDRADAAFLAVTVGIDLFKGAPSAFLTAGFASASLAFFFFSSEFLCLSLRK